MLHHIILLYIACDYNVHYYKPISIYNNVTTGYPSMSLSILFNSIPIRIWQIMGSYSLQVPCISLFFSCILHVNLVICQCLNKV